MKSRFARLPSLDVPDAKASITPHAADDMSHVEITHSYVVELNVTTTYLTTPFSSLQGVQCV